MSSLHEMYKFDFLNPDGLSERAMRDINLLLAQLSPNSLGALTVSRMKTLLIHSEIRIATAKHGSAIIGMGYVCKIPNLRRVVCEIHDLVVDSEHQGKGVAREILGMLCAEARNRYHADHIELTCRPEREPANKLYLSCDFELRKTNCYRKKLVYD